MDSVEPRVFDKFLAAQAVSYLDDDLDELDYWSKFRGQSGLVLELEDASAAYRRRQEPRSRERGGGFSNE